MLLAILLITLGFLVAGPRLEPIAFEDVRWFLAAHALGGGLLLTRLEDPILALGFAGLWLSPILIMWQRAPADGLLIAMPSLIALGVGLALLIWMRDMILAGKASVLRISLLGACAVSLGKQAYDWIVLRMTLRPGRLVTSPFILRVGYVGAVGSAGNPMHFGAMMALGVTLLISTATSWWVLVIGALLGLGVLISRSRTALAAMVVTLLIIIPWWAAPVVGGFCILGCIVRMMPQPSAWWWFRSQLTGEPRWRIWRLTVSVIRMRPWIGVGLGAFHEAIGRHALSERAPGGATNAHCEPLTVAAECGIPTAAALTAWWAWRFLGAASAGQLETAVGLGVLGLLATFGFPIRWPATAPFAVYYGARALAGA